MFENKLIDYTKNTNHEQGVRNYDNIRSKSKDKKILKSSSSSGNMSKLIQRNNQKNQKPLIKKK